MSNPLHKTSKMKEFVTFVKVQSKSYKVNERVRKSSCPNIFIFLPSRVSRLAISMVFLTPQAKSVLA